MKVSAGTDPAIGPNRIWFAFIDEMHCKRRDFRVVLRCLAAFIAFVFKENVGMNLEDEHKSGSVFETSTESSILLRRIHVFTGHFLYFASAIYVCNRFVFLGRF